MGRINYLRNLFYIFLFLNVFIVLLSCTRSSLKEKKDALRITKKLPIIADDLDRESLIKGLKDNIEFLQNINKEYFIFGKRNISKEDYLLSLNYFVWLLENVNSNKKFKKRIKQDFEFYEVYGNKKWGRVFITSYFTPVISGSLKKTKQHTQPLYFNPEDLVTIRLDEFAKVNSGLGKLLNYTKEQKSQLSILRGRLIKSMDANSPHEIVPYFDRKQIDQEKKINDEKKVICWVDPIESFFMQIQGSGIVVFENKKRILLNYSSQNGHYYYPIGKELLDYISLEEMSLNAIVNHLEQLSNDEIQEIFNKNPSYVFFRVLENSKAKTTMGTEVISGRTIATDGRYFSKGMLGFLIFPKPIFNNDFAIEPVNWQRTSRFVIDQDTGGAIRGGGRVDLYWGEGKKARQSASVMKSWGRLYYLVLKQDVIDNLKDKEVLP